jgi:acetyl-CoA synthetase
VQQSSALPHAQWLIDRVKARIGPHVAPRGVVFVDTLPMTATGKVMRCMSRDMVV